MNHHLGRAVATVCLLTVTSSIGYAQAAKPAAAEETAELAKKLSNPISDLVSVPFQFNWEQNVGPSELTRFILNVQPVMPFELNSDWNMITRIIMPLVSQPPLFAGDEATFGISDITASFFFSPRRRAGSRLGAGPGLRAAVDERADARLRQVEHGTDGGGVATGQDRGPTVRCGTRCGRSRATQAART